MFRVKTVFVLGAGSSCEVGLPSGEALKGEIGRKLDMKFSDGIRLSSGDPWIVDALRRHLAERRDITGNINPYLERAWALVDGLPLAISIDNLLYSHQDEKAQLCGKLGIIRSILDAEAASELAFDTIRGQVFQSTMGETSWLNGFIKILTEQVPLEDIESIFENVTIINFNYDRCVEHYLFNALQKYYTISAEKSAEIMASLKIIHPYGQVGKLPWQDSSVESVAFGSRRCNLLRVAEQIRTFNEQVEDQQLLASIKEAMQSAARAVFLGFAFHRQNLELIKPGAPSEIVEMFATAHGISGSDCNAIEYELHKLLQRPQPASIVIRNHIKCAQLFSEFWRSLSTD